MNPDSPMYLQRSMKSASFHLPCPWFLRTDRWCTVFTAGEPEPDPGGAP